MKYTDWGQGNLSIRRTRNVKLPSSWNAIKHFNSLINVLVTSETILRHTIKCLNSMCPNGTSGVRITLLEYLKVYRSEWRTTVRGLLSHRGIRFQVGCVSQAYVSHLLGSMTPVTLQVLSQSLRNSTITLKILFVNFMQQLASVIFPKIQGCNR